MRIGGRGNTVAGHLAGRCGDVISLLLKMTVTSSSLLRTFQDAQIASPLKLTVKYVMRSRTSALWLYRLGIGKKKERFLRRC